MKMKYISILGGILLLASWITACRSGSLAIGESAPGFTLPAADGSSVSLSDYQDKPVLLFFHMAVG